MRHLFIIALLIFPSNIINGQNQIIYSIDSDTSYWFRYQTMIFEKIKDIKPFDLNSKYHFRLVFHGQVTSNTIDIWSDDGKNFNSEVVVWTKEYVPYPEEHTNRYYFKKKAFDSSFSKAALDIIKISDIRNVPTDSLIKNWQQGFDGVEFIIETINDNDCSFKQYWTPSSQDTIIEAQKINKLITDLWHLFNVNEYDKAFSKEIPFECYNTGGPTLVCKVLTKKQRRQYKRERKNYRQQQV